MISIHVPREGDDEQAATNFPIRSLISIHVPREGDDSLELYAYIDGQLFQSTSPVRGTTAAASGLGQAHTISIHVPREGDDHFPLVVQVIRLGFQSTSPVRGTTSGHYVQISYDADFNPRPP